jgi:septal ring factor EnvC (AmiA/AmiB activator)
MARHLRGSAQRLLQAALLMAALGGCAIQEMNRDIDASQGRIGNKERELGTLERQQAALQTERDRLQTDLRTQDMSVSQLKGRLDRLRQLNEAAPVATPQQRVQRDERARKLDDTTRRAQALEQDASLSQQEKTKRLEALKEQTRNMLNLLLVG